MRLERMQPLPGAGAARVDWRIPVLAGVAATAATVLGYTLSTAPILLVGLVAVSIAAVAVLLSFDQPRWALVVALFLGWGYLPDVASLYHGNGMPLTGALLACLIVPLTIRCGFRLERVRLPATELALIGAFALTMIVSMALSTDPSAGFQRLVLFVKDVPFCILMLLLIDRIEWLRRAGWAAVIAFGGLGAIAVLQQVTHTYSRSYLGLAAVQNDQGGLIRSAGPLSTDWFGWELVPVTILALYLALGARRRNIRIFAWSLFAASLFGLIFSFARASLIAICVAFVLAALLRRVQLPTIALGIAVGVVAMVLFLPATAKNRLVQTVEPFTGGGGNISMAQDVSVRNRAGENLAAVHMFFDYPILGVGPGNYPVLYTTYSQTIALDTRNEGRHPHNLYLEYLSETGVIGGTLIFSLMGLALLGAWRARRVFEGRDRLLVEGVFVALVGYYINGIFLHPSGYSRYLWLVLGFGLVCGRLAAKKEASA